MGNIKDVLTEGRSRRLAEQAQREKKAKHKLEREHREQATLAEIESLQTQLDDLKQSDAYQRQLHEELKLLRQSTPRTLAEIDTELRNLARLRRLLGD